MDSPAPQCQRYVCVEFMCLRARKHVCLHDFIGGRTLHVQTPVERRRGCESVLGSKVKFAAVCPPPKILGRAPQGAVLESTGPRCTCLLLSHPLGPTAAERGLCASEPRVEGRGVSQLPPPPQHERQRGRRTGAGGRGLGGGCPGLRIPPPEGRGGARRCPPPSVPFSRPLPGAARAGVTAACGKLGAGRRDPSRPKAALTVSPAAHRPSAAPDCVPSPEGQAGAQDCVLGEPGARARGAGMSGSRLRGAPEPEPRGAFGIATWRNSSPGRSVSAPMLGTL